MRVCILGPLEVWEDRTRLQLGHGRQRALLALLVLHANEVVSTDRLVDGLWGEHPPATATKVIQGYVSQLRKVLPERALVTHAAGYVLRAADTDVAEFERLVDQARSQEPTEAAGTLRRALALWRGRPLTDVEYETWAQTEIARLEDLRLAAVEDRIEAELQLGQQVQLVPELEALVAEHPLRERLRSKLMLALYRSGRQADALTAYADARRHLIDELGIEPGPELQDLQRRILGHDPELGSIPAPRPLATRHRARWLIGVGAILVAGAVAGAAIELMRDGAPSPSSVVPDSLAIVDPETNTLAGQVELLGAPSLVAAGGSSIWVVSDLSRTISLIEMSTRTRMHVVALGATPGALGADGGAVWVLDGIRRKLLKIDPAYGAVTKRIGLPRAPAVRAAERDRGSLSVSVGAGALWVTDGSTQLLRVDRESGRVVRSLDVHEPLDDVAVGAGAVWAISARAASVFQIDTQARAVKSRIRVVNRRGTAGPFPVAVVVSEGSVWVLNRNTQTVSRIDPEFGAVTATIPLGIGRNPVDLAAGAGAVWVANGGDGTLARIDPGTNSVATVALGGSPAGVAVGGNHVWVSIQPGFRALARSPVERAHGPPPKTLPASMCSAVEFQGTGHPRYLIASDLPFQGLAAAAETLQMSDAVRFILAKRKFRAGRHSVGYQSCDDSIASTGSYDVDRCRGNAQAYAATKSVIGVVGGFNSGCAQAQLAVLAAAPGGPLALIGTASTYVGLTRTGPGTTRDEPEKYRPDGKRSFLRVVATDDLQGAANAILAQRLGVRRLFVLHDGDPYGFGIAASVRRAATKLGLDVVGFEQWDPRARAYGALGRAVREAAADGAFLGGSADISNGYSLVRNLRAILGDRFHVLVPDGFTPVSAFARLAGPAAEGVTLTLTAAAPERLRGEGERFVTEFREAIGRPVEAYSVAAAQAAEVLLDAIARSDGSRASVTAELFKAKVTNGILGSFSFDRNGDTTAGAVTIYRIVRGKATIFGVITPSPSLVR